MFHQKTKMFKPSLGIIIIICLLASGCATAVHNSMKPTEKTSSWSSISQQGKKTSKKKSQTPPESMAVIWKDNTYESEKGLVVRGFEGRVYFHNSNNEPIKASGDLVVYGFDDTQATPDFKSKTPTKKFVITAEELESNYVETHIGPSYRVWIPWEPVGGTRKTINLIPIFKMADGKIIRSGSSINVLPGKTASSNGQLATQDVQLQSANGNQVGLANYSGNSTSSVSQAAMQDEPISQPTIRSTTIPLVPTLSSRLSLPQAAALNQAAAAEGASLESNRVKSAESTHLSPSQPMPETNSTRGLNATIRSDRSDRSANQSGVFGVPGSFR
jgi:hypothetical protein